MSSSDPSGHTRVGSVLTRRGVNFSRNRAVRRLAQFAPVIFLTLLSQAGCGRKDSGPPPNYAFIDFENLSGDPSLDWVTRGSSEYLSRSLHDSLGRVMSSEAVARATQPFGSRPSGAGANAERSGAIVAGATRTVGGYIERTAGGIRITASEEDVASHKSLRNLSATAATPFDALNLLAHQFSDSAGQPATTNPEAFRLYCTALQGPGPEAPATLERAIALDPTFGPAWVTLVRVLAALGDRPHAIDAIQRARAQKLAALDLAWLNFEDASLGGDRNASLAAMRNISVLDPRDAGLLRLLATAETNAGNFTEAAAAWKKLTAINPDDADAWNQRGYTLSWSGDYPGALAALREYARLRPNDPNPLDSQGDVHYWFGKFADAANSYSAAYTKFPAFLNGGDLYKAAWAKFRSGDKTGADSFFGKFREARQKANDPSIDLFAGDWLYRTGRRDEARALLMESLKNVPANLPAVRSAIAAQLAIWDLVEGNRAAAAREITADGTSTFTPGELIIRFAALPSASAAEWEARANQNLAAPQLGGIRSLALGYALILDGKRQAAVPVWEQIVKQSAGADFYPREILARLKNVPYDHQAPPDSANPNPLAAVPDKLASSR